jgi:hypothetical protein
MTRGDKRQRESAVGRITSYSGAKPAALAVPFGRLASNACRFDAAVPQNSRYRTCAASGDVAVLVFFTHVTIAVPG